jgi:hypothetical protein
MNKLTLLIAIVALFASSLKAQYDDIYTFEQGKSLIGVNAGVNMGFGKFTGDKSTAVSAFYEYCLTKLFVDECTLGGGFFGGYYKYSFGAEVQRIYIAGLRVNVHYQFIDRFDTYAGFDPNYHITTYKIDHDISRFAVYFHVGGRYYLTNWLGVFAEASTGFNNFSGGVSVKF